MESFPAFPPFKKYKQSICPTEKEILFVVEPRSYLLEFYIYGCMLNFSKSHTVINMCLDNNFGSTS